MAEKTIKLESMVDSDLELAYDKAKNLINQKVPEEQKTGALQKIMDTLKNDPNSRDAFVANPAEFSAKVLGIDPSPEVKPNESIGPKESNDEGNTDGFQITYSDGKKVLRIFNKFKDPQRALITAAEGSTSLAKAAGFYVAIDFDALKAGEPFHMQVWDGNKWQGWNSNAPITEVKKIAIPDDELNNALFARDKYPDPSYEQLGNGTTKDEGTPEESANEEEQVEGTPEDGNDEQGEDADLATPDEEDAAKETALDKLAKIYPVMAKEYKLRFRNNGEDAEKLAEYTLKIVEGKGNNAAKWKQYLDEKCKNGTNKAMIQNKVIPTLVKAYNAKGKDEIELTRQVNDEQVAGIKDRNGNAAGRIVVPEGFNQPPIELGDQVVTMDFGYPAINFNSTLIKEIVGETDKPRLKKLLKALMNRIDGSPAGKALIKNFIFSFSLTKTTKGVKRSEMYKLIKEAASAKGIPMLRRPLKVESEQLVGKSEADTITVQPLNAIANPKNESLDFLEYDPLFEGWFSENVLGQSKDENEQHVHGKPVELPAAYVKQFYTILVPSGPTGLHNYARYMTDRERNAIYEKLGENSEEEIKTGNRNVNDMILQRYLAETNGVPPFYLLMPRTKPTKERLRVCDDTVVNGKVCIKSIEGKNKDAYFMDKDKIDSVFEAG